MNQVIKVQVIHVLLKGFVLGNFFKSADYFKKQFVQIGRFNVCYCVCRTVCL